MVSLTSSNHDGLIWEPVISSLFKKNQPTTIPNWPLFNKDTTDQKTAISLPISYLEGAANEPHLFYLPSEYDTTDDLKDMFNPLKSLDFTIFCCDYGSFWQKHPDMGIDTLSEAITTALTSVSEWMEGQGRKGPLVVMGRSIGSAFAIHSAACMCQRTACLIVESGFDNTIELLQKMGKDTAGLSGDPFSNRQKMRTYTKPVLFLHSSRDEYVTITQVEWLVMESRSKATQFQLVPSPNRASLFSSTSEFYLQALKDFIYLRMGRRPKLKRQLKTTAEN